VALGTAAGKASEALPFLPLYIFQVLPSVVLQHLSSFKEAIDDWLRSVRIGHSKWAMENEAIGAHQHMRTIVKSPDRLPKAPYALLKRN
jgi:hypothetical protein